MELIVVDEEFRFSIVVEVDDVELSEEGESADVLVERLSVA